MNEFKNADGKSILIKMVHAVQANKEYLGEVDGLIGDGDHGMNMNKGFTLFETRFGEKDISFTEGLDELGMILLNEIGGSMGPIYGTVFMEMAEKGRNLDFVGAAQLGDMLAAGLEGLSSIVEARVGDKTLVDALAPCVKAMETDVKLGVTFQKALLNMKKAAETGRDSTKDMIAKFGRSSRLGERSIGVLDAGAVSCCVILCAMADGIQEVLQGEYKK